MYTQARYRVIGLFQVKLRKLWSHKRFQRCSYSFYPAISAFQIRKKRERSGKVDLASRNRTKLPAKCYRSRFALIVVCWWRTRTVWYSCVAFRPLAILYGRDEKGCTLSKADTLGTKATVRFRESSGYLIPEPRNLGFRTVYNVHMWTRCVPVIRLRYFQVCYEFLLIRCPFSEVSNHIFEKKNVSAVRRVRGVRLRQSSVTEIQVQFNPLISQNVIWYHTYHLMCVHRTGYNANHKLFNQLQLQSSAVRESHWHRGGQSINQSTLFDLQFRTEEILHNIGVS